MTVMLLEDVLWLILLVLIALFLAWTFRKIIAIPVAFVYALIICLIMNIFAYPMQVYAFTRAVYKWMLKEDD